MKARIWIYAVDYCGLDETVYETKDLDSPPKEYPLTFTSPAATRALHIQTETEIVHTECRRKLSTFKQFIHGKPFIINQ